MSKVVEQLIEKWIQKNAPVFNSITEPSEEDYEDFKGYIPESLRIQFKVFCAQKQVTMSSTIYNLINEWVKTRTD